MRLDYGQFMGGIFQGFAVFFSRVWKESTDSFISAIWGDIKLRMVRVRPQSLLS